MNKLLKSNMSKILLIDKPKGITSFDVIRQLRKKLGIRKMGHAGTLDPRASGLMIIGIEKGTKQLKNYVRLNKIYKAEVLLGIQTDSGDMEGTILRQAPVPSFSQSTIEEVLQGLLGRHILPVSKFSATKIQGTPAHKHARSGKDVPPLKREMEILDITLCTYSTRKDTALLDIELEVSSGTYIRSIAEEIGRRLHVPATLNELRRTHIGHFSVAEARTL